jgi:hypothetical protein
LETLLSRTEQHSTIEELLGTLLSSTEPTLNNRGTVGNTSLQN